MLFRPVVKTFIHFKTISDIEIVTNFIRDPETNVSRGFAFINFDSFESADTGINLVVFFVISFFLVLQKNYFFLLSLNSFLQQSNR